MFVERGKIARCLQLPCGRCVGCRLERSRQWAVRCMHESQMHAASSFVTLTYDDAHLPQYGSLRYRDFQLFMKRVRKHFSRRVPFYMCGEYGEENGRPHYHALLFGVFFDDRTLYKRAGSGSNLFSSATLGRLWPAGGSLIGDVTFESAAYVARYVMKKVTGPLAELHYERVDDVTGEVYRVEPEFNRMSLRPGIGRAWIEKFKTEVLVHDGVVSNGHLSAVPRYYDNYLRDVAEDAFVDIDVNRYRKSLRSAADGSPERLAVREQVANARLSFKRRNSV